jgi:N-methylhydantoinase A/oxoprolinase/acetone carboxylase beta subunit
MASADDILNALNGANSRLDNIKSAVDNVTTAVNATTAAVNSAATQITAALNAGFAQLVSLGQYTNQALYHLSQQDDTIICALENISRNTCNLVTQSVIQTTLQERIAHSTGKLSELYASVHAEAALQRHRMEELREEIERCCPPEKPPPACTYQPCALAGQLPPPPSRGTTQ